MGRARARPTAAPGDRAWTRHLRRQRRRHLLVRRWTQRSDAPTTYRLPLPATDPRASRWPYIRVAGLGILPRLLCPHYDATQSNDVLRAADFEAMMVRHPAETGLGLDDIAGLVVDGDAYRVVEPVGRPGSVGPSGFVADGSGRPGLWRHEVVAGAVEVELAPAQGQLADLVRPARVMVGDPRIPSARAENRPPLR